MGARRVSESKDLRERRTAVLPRNASTYFGIAGAGLRVVVAPLARERGRHEVRFVEEHHVRGSVAALAAQAEAVVATAVGQRHGAAVVVEVTARLLQEVLLAVHVQRERLLVHADAAAAVQLLRVGRPQLVRLALHQLHVALEQLIQRLVPQVGDLRQLRVADAPQLALVEVRRQREPRPLRRQSPRFAVRRLEITHLLHPPRHLSLTTGH